MSDTHEDILLWFICEHGGKGIVTTDKLAEIIGESKETLHEWISYDNENGIQTMIMAIEAIKNGQTEIASVTDETIKADKTRDSFIMYRSWVEALHDFSDDLETYHELSEAILFYALDGIIPNIKSKYARSVFTAIEPVISNNRQRFINGCKGGRPKNNQNKT